MATTPLIINEWNDAMGDSPNVGLGLVQNASIDAVPGTVQPNYMPALNSFPTNHSQTFTWNVSGTCDLTSPDTVLQTDGVAVTFSTAGGGTLDSNITAGTIYFLYKFASGRVIIADTLGHALSHNNLSLAGNGSGTCTVTTVDIGTVNSYAQGNDANGTNVAYFGDSNGRVWYSEGTTGTYLLNGNTITNGDGQGLCLFPVSDGSAIYLFVFRNATIDVCDVSTQSKRRDPVGNSCWTTAWESLNSGAGSNAVHQALLGYDNIVYACDSRYIVSIQEVPGQVFAPGSSGTYSYNSKALTLPANDIAQCLEQLGQDLLVGGGYTNLIYPWDRISPSFDLPLLSPEVGIYGMKNIGNKVYILAGLRGIVYSTTGYLVTQVRKLPEHLFQSTSGGSNLITWGGVAAKNGAFMFGVSGLNGAAGIFLIYPDGRLIWENTPSQGQLLPRVLGNQSGEFYFSGYAGGVDLVSTNRYDTLGNSLVQSRLYNVGTRFEKTTYSILECQLDQPGGSGGQIRISYRTGVTGSFTTLATYTLDGTTTSFDSDVGLIDIENIQIQVEVASVANGASGTSAARVREVRLLP